MARIVLGGGCFWCLEAVFLRVRGVLAVESAYANGHLASPSYEDVCSGHTGHAEVVAVSYEPTQVTLEALLTVFFAMHDPTTLNRQGNDIGSQYRSGIYTEDDEQARAVQAFMADLPHDPHWAGAQVVTEVQPLSAYWPAEAYHQDYFARHPSQGYCAFIIAPKVQKLMREHSAMLA
jgi:peptide-methionine (S)-S-oxide reductase